MSKRVCTVVVTLALMWIAGGLHVLWRYKLFLNSFPWLATIMLEMTALDVLFTYIFKLFHRTTLQVILSILTFVVVCTCLFYSQDAVDFVNFFICMAVIIHEASVVKKNLDGNEPPD